MGRVNQGLISVYIDIEHHREFRNYSKRVGKTVTQLIRDFVAGILDEKVTIMITKEQSLNNLYKVES